MATREYASASIATRRWLGLWDMTLSGGVRSLDMLEACANVHNLGTSTCTTDHPWMSELEERQALDGVMQTVFDVVALADWTRWFAYYNSRIGKRGASVKHVDGIIEYQLKQAGMLRGRYG